MHCDARKIISKTRSLLPFRIESLKLSGNRAVEHTDTE